MSAVTDSTNTLGGNRILDDAARLSRTFAACADQEALLDTRTGTSLDYRGLLAASDGWATHLEGRDLPAGATVIARLPNGIPLASLLLGAALAGIRIAPMDAAAGRDTQADAMATLVPAAFIDDPDAGALGDAMRGQRRLEVLEFDAPWLLTQTSGSTGQPKWVVHSLGDLVRCSYAFGERHDLSGRSFLHHLSMAYMAGILNLLIVPLCHGGRVVFKDRFSVADAMRFWEVPEQAGCNAYWLVPTQIELLLKLDRGTQGIDHCRRVSPLVFAGTAPLARHAKAAFTKKYGVAIYESYGLSETLINTVEEPGGPGNTPNSGPTLGRPLPGVDLSFTVDGEVSVDSPWNLSQYETQPPAPKPFQTGDLGKLVAGALVLTGRKKDIILRGGANISPQRIERTLAELLPGVPCGVVGGPEPTLGEQTFCFVEASMTSMPEDWKRQVTQGLNEHLGPDHVIDEFRTVDALPRTDTGKLDRPALRRAAST